MIGDERDLRRQRMKEFYELTHILFTKPERLILYKILKDYKRRCDLDRLIVGLSLVLRTYTKLELLKYVRYFLWEGHIPEFDRATKFHSRFRPRRRDHDYDARAGTSYLQVPDRQSLGSTHTRGSGMTTSSTGRGHFKDVRVFTIHRTSGGNGGLGFSVRGGSEHGLGIYVSEIESGSAAENSGLEAGDKILEANNVSLKGVASSSAIRVLTGAGRLKLVVQRTRKVPEWRLSREKTSWYDVHDNRLISGEFEECGISHHIRGLDVDIPERRVSLNFERGERNLGFNIRGGREYGLGIYVSKLDKGGPADKNGVHVGDQIIDVNGIPFENITHAHAVEVMKDRRHLILTLRDVGRYPVYKELYAEYTWSEGQLKAASSVTSLRDVQFEKEGLQNKALSVSDIFTRHRRPSSLQNEIFLPKKPPRRNLNRNKDQLVEHEGGDDDEIVQESDSESLINIEQWTRHICEDGTENNGYISDDDDENGNGVVRVHVELVDDNVEETGTIGSTRSGTIHSRKSGQLLNTGDGVNDDSIDADDVDNLYSKINKRDSRVNEYSNSRSENEAHYSNSSFGSDHDIQEQHVNNIYGNDVSNDNLRGENNDKDVISSHKVEGAMYYQVNRTSSYTNFAQPHASTSKTDVESVNSNNSNECQEQTLQIRSFPRDSDSSDGSDEEDMHSKVDKRKGYSKKYSFHNDETHDVSYQVNVGLNKHGHGNSKSEPVIVRSHIAGNENFNVEDLGNRLRELEKRQMSLGLNELNSLSPKHENGGEPKLKKGKWKNFKEKVKGSLRIKTSGHSSKTSSARKGVFLEHRNNNFDGYNMASLEDEAKNLLSNDEFEAVMRHVKYYHETHDLERLVDTLLDILDKPEKLMLLREIRGVIYPLDMVRFDNRVNVYEIEAYQKLSMKLHLPLNHKPQKKPRKTLMTTEIGNRRKRKSVHFAQPDEAIASQSSSDKDTDDSKAENGHFHIRPMDQYRKEEEVVALMKEHVDDARHVTPSKQPMTAQLTPRVGGTHLTSLPRQPITSQKSLEEASVMGQFDYLDKENGEDNLSVIISSDPGSYGSSEVERTPGAMTVHLSKNKPHIGIELKEVMEHSIKDVRINKILPTGAANDDSEVEEGMTLLAVDSHRVEGCTADEALAILQRCYADKHIVSMKLVLHKPQMTHF